jgi:hypothetical protein
MITSRIPFPAAINHGTDREALRDLVQKYGEENKEANLYIKLGGGGDRDPVEKRMDHESADARVCRPA